MLIISNFQTMKPLLNDVNYLLSNELLYIKEIKTSFLRENVHFHNAYEIALILKGKGKRIVGDNIDYFSDNDIVLIGPNLPHVTSNHRLYNSAKKINDLSAIVVYFNPNWFTQNILTSSDFTKINQLIDKMSRGVEVLGNTKKKVTNSLKELKSLQGLGKVIKLWEVLYLISESEEYKCLASESYSSNPMQQQTDRLDKVHQYVKNRYADLIKLADISAVVNMTPSSFCKYFKSNTGKTFTDYINEVRIGQACKLLYNFEMTISEVCYSCGYNNLTNFNRNFKRYTKRTPSEYRMELTFKK